MKCFYCQSELVEDSFGAFCPNEKCDSIDGMAKTFETGLFRRMSIPLVKRIYPTLIYDKLLFKKK
jgi:hypothetical protein